MRRAGFIVTMISAAAMAAPALAQGQGQRQRQDRQRTQARQTQPDAQRQRQQAMNRRQAQQRQSASQMRRDLAPRRVDGRVIELRPVRPVGQQERTVLALVELADGRTAVLDLGRESHLRNRRVNLRRNQPISAIGVIGRANGRPILVVDRFVGDNQVTLIRPVIEQQRQRQRARQSQIARQQRQRAGSPERTARARQAPVQVIQGHLVDTRDVQLSGLPDSHRLAKLETRAGQTVIVDLGTNDQLKDIKLSSGDWVAVVGNVGRVNDRPVVFATHVADIATIERADIRQRQQQQRRQQRDQSQQRQQRQQRSNQSS